MNHLKYSKIYIFVGDQIKRKKTITQTTKYNKVTDGICTPIQKTKSF